MPNPQNILFRCDSSATIGTGHVMRDLVLAKTFENANIFFATKELEGNINHKIFETGYPLYTLESDSVEELTALIQGLKIDTIVIDHYSIDYGFETQLKKLTGVQIFALDDTYEKHNCDILLNHNIYADTKRYETLVPLHCELRCGSNYTLLREEFKNAKTKPPAKDPKQVLVAMGGTDSANLNIKILKVLKEFDLHPVVVTTKANRHLPELKQYAADNPIALHVNANNVAELIAQSAFAIVSPSVTLNEIMFMELPFIAIKTAENQRFMCDYLRQNNLPVLLKFNETTLRKALVHLLEDSLMLVDFTNLNEEEKELVLTWRNHPDIRKWMFTQHKITLEEHLSFIENLQQRKDRHYFLLKCASFPAGTVSLTDIDYEKKEAGLGIYAAPDTKGFGKILLKAITDYAKKTLGLVKIYAEVLHKNEKAVKLYEKHGFKTHHLAQKNGLEIIVMELTL